MLKLGKEIKTREDSTNIDSTDKSVKLGVSAKIKRLEKKKQPDKI